MNRLRIIYFLFFLFIISKINAQDFRFGWNIGSINLYGDIKNDESDVDCNIFHFNWIINKFSLGFNILDIYDFNQKKYNGIIKYSILPVKLSYVLLSDNDWLFLSVYGKAGWQLTRIINDDDINHDIYGSFGIQLFAFPELIYNYSPYFALFCEYDTYKRLKIGLSLDLSIVSYFILRAWAESYR